MSINLLWTGGWDSTFQLLRLLLVDRSTVTPFYIIDHRRQSTDIEIETMACIRADLFEQFPFTRELLRDTSFAFAENCRPDHEIRAAIRAIRQRERIAQQYAWLAKFCKDSGIENMQMSIHAETNRVETQFDFERLVSDIGNEGQTVFRMDPELDGRPEGVLFRYFTFPLIKFTKLDMFEVAEAQGWGDLMAMTWFCRFPTEAGQPCGRCHTCQQAINEGFGWRVPIEGE